MPVDTTYEQLLTIHISRRILKNGYTGSPTGRVDTKYEVNYNILWDSETISIECDKDGTVTHYDEHEAI